MIVRGGVSWLSSSSAEIARARNVLKALTPGGVIDELGFLVLQGAFAEQFYPAVTTPMTRARYLIFVPAIYQYLERSGKAAGRDVDRVSRDLQFDLLQSVREEDGAIGKESGRQIVRPPSEIYWNALAVLGLATQRVSEASYQRRLSAGAFRLEVLQDDDKVAYPDDAESLWDTSLRLSHVLPDGVFPSKNSLRLRTSEARLLRERYGAVKPGGRESLISHLVSLADRRRLDDFDAITNVWDVPDLPVETQVTVDHGRKLSLFAKGTTLQYHRMLIEKKGAEDPGAADAFAAWWEAAQGELASWDIDDFFAHIRRWDANRRPVQDSEFLREWIRRCTAATSGPAALNDETARAIIRRREDRVRPGKQRFKVKYQFDSWRMLPRYRPEDLYQLRYRHPQGLQFAEDIADGLLRGTA